MISDGFLADQQRRIDKHGWVAIGVGAGPDSPSFTYTSGLFTPLFSGHPELIVFALPWTTAHQMLGILVDRIKDGARLAHGDVLSGVAMGFDVVLIEVDDTTVHLTVANALYRRRAGLLGHPAPVPALQLIFPDQEHRWPWDPHSATRTSPRLGRIPDGLR